MRVLRTRARWAAARGETRKCVAPAQIPGVSQAQPRHYYQLQGDRVQFITSLRHHRRSDTARSGQGRSPRPHAMDSSSGQTGSLAAAEKWPVDPGKEAATCCQTGDTLLLFFLLLPLGGICDALDHVTDWDYKCADASFLLRFCCCCCCFYLGK